MTEEPVNEEFVETLRGMGIDEPLAREALFCTQSSSVDAALEYLFSAEGFNNEEEEEEGAAADGRSYKMVFVVNTSLDMGVGKIAAQVAHACLGLYRHISKNPDCKKMLDLWEYQGEKKIVVKAKDHTELVALQEKANGSFIPSYLVHDAGHTQIPPDSMTVLSLFSEEEHLNSITGELKLL